MASDLNKVLIDLYIPRDARLVETKNGGGFISIAGGATESWKNDAGEWQNRTAWVDVVFRRSTSEKLVAALTEGTRIRVEGKLETYTREDDEGKKTKVTQIGAEKIEFLPDDRRGGGNGGNGGGGGGRARDEQTDEAPPRRASGSGNRRRRGGGDEDSAQW